MASKRRKVYKRKVIMTSKEKQKNALYRETLENVRKVNQRLNSLERRYKSGTWSTKKLLNRLDSSTISALRRGRVQINKTMTTTQLKAIQKATSQFLASKTSTKAGIKSVKSETIKSIKSTLNEFEEDNYTDEEVEMMYDMLGDNDFDSFNDKIGASAMWAMIDDAIDANDTEEDFLSRLNNIISISNDVDFTNRAKRLYSKYVV